MEDETNALEQVITNGLADADVIVVTNEVVVVATNFVGSLGSSMAHSKEAVNRFGEWLRTQFPQWLATDGLAIVITVVIALVALRVAVLAAGRLTLLMTRGRKDGESLKRAQTLSGVIRWVLHLTVYLVAGMMVLSKLGVEIGPIIAAAGIVGLAVGFGAQTLVQDIISGFFILLEDQVRVGDVVNLNGKGGLVERITLRMTVLRDFNGNVHYVRNGQIDVVTNMTKDYSNYVFEVGVAYRENVDQVIEVLKQIDEGMRRDPEYQQDILAPLEVAGLDKFDSSAVVIKARIRTQPIKQWRVGREFNRRIKMKFDELGIEIPFPHVTVYPGKDKRDESPSLVVALQDAASHPAPRKKSPK
jgi:moderate conductance mechanosensitive channel